MRVSVVVVLILSAFIALSSQQSFYANEVSITMPNMLGALSARMYYDAPAKKAQIEYYKIGLTEVYNFVDLVKYRKCSTCVAESINYDVWKFYSGVAGETASGYTCESGATSAAYDRSGGTFDVTRIAFGSNGQVCRAQLGNGQTFTFKSFSSGAAAYDTTGCPQKQCSQKLDMMLIMDESGSIDNNEWNSIKTFVNQFTQAFQVSESAAKIGLVAYSSSSILRFPYQNDQQSFRNTMTNLRRYWGSGNTYTNSALTNAYQAYTQYARRSPVQHITVVITDGFCSCVDSQLTSSSAPLKDVGYVFAVGVDGADKTELDLIASGSGGFANINGQTIQTSFFVNQFGQLNTILNQLIAATCTEFAGNPCGAGCQGFCGCNQQCLCPDDCSKFGDYCNSGVCTANANGAGCYTVAADPCNDNNVCTSEYCTAATQSCNRANIDCPDKPCFTKSCNPASGCVYTPVACSDGNPCTVDQCNPSTGQCEYPAKVCNDFNACTIDSCDGSGTCQHVQRTDCVDANGCTVDSCNPNTGCIFTPLNEALTCNTPGCLGSPAGTPCNDNNLCTNEYCSNSACVSAPVVCPDKPCFTKVCNPASGCVYTPIPCNDGDPCTTDQCNPNTGLCEYPSTPCAYCSANGITTASCQLGKPKCENWDCVQSGPSSGGCAKVSDVTCNDLNACTVDQCIASDGSCSNVARTDCVDGNVCTIDSCDVNSGCVFTAINEALTCNTPGCYASPAGTPCDDNNLCTNEYCSSATQACVRSNVECPDKPCFTKSCDPKSGCVYTPVDCTDTDVCTAEFCNVNTNQCEYPQKDCDDLNACTVDSCEQGVGTCLHAPRTDCNDSNACTIDSCDTATGCVYTTVNETEYCDDRSLCTIDTCDTTTGCVYTPINCTSDNLCIAGQCGSAVGCLYPFRNCAEEPEIKGRIGDCFAALCNDGGSLVDKNQTVGDKLGCYVVAQPGTKVDKCGVCNGNDFCFPLTVAEVAGISAAVIGLIVAGVAAFMIAGAIGAKKGYDAYLRNKNNVAGASSNPLYNDGGRTGNNPFYEMNNK